ncbi:MAG: hypothetical protein KDJ28_05730 [Candidatus Competibacteraceae bacterium]|nr:hypothetical protein [Candidatus Competibacteraceae bacterium]
MTALFYWLRHQKRSLCNVLLFLLIIGLTLMTYWPGLSGSFLLDDFVNLDKLGKFGGVHNWETFKQYLIGDNHGGPSGRFLSMLSFLLNDNGWPSSPLSFKYTNLLLHLLTGILLTWLIYRLMLAYDRERRDNRAASIALLTTALWLLHPFNISTTLYIVQRMAILSALFSIIGLLVYVRGRELLNCQPRRAYLWMTLSVIVCTPLAVFSKENGALLPLLILVIEYTVLRHNIAQHKPASQWLIIFLGLPNILLIGYFVIHWDTILNGYQIRSFTMTERILTESRVIFQYLHHLLIPKPDAQGIFNENFIPSSGLISPPSTLIAILFIAVSVIGGWWVRVRYPLLSLAILFFFAGHLLESTFISLEIYFEHRNYLPSIFLFLPLTSWLIRKFEKPICMTSIISIPFIGLFAFLVYQQTTLWGNHYKLATYWAQKNPYSIRAQQTLVAEFELRGRPDLALQYLERTINRIPDNFELRLHRMILLCQYFSISSDEFFEFKKSARQDFYNFQTYSLLEGFINMIIDHHCSNITPKSVHNFLDAFLKNNTARINYEKNKKRQIYHLHGLVYIKENQAILALRSFKESQQYMPDTEAGLLQVSLLANSRMFSEGLELLKIIKDNLKNNHEKLSYQKKMNFINEIVRIEKFLLEDLAKAGQPAPIAPQSP